ncbi:MAG: hypothetical protein HC817_07440 [Saprospiraceae bacterium]|nr:hypothetical protein [Saprospiraceae bacterium]
MRYKESCFELRYYHAKEIEGNNYTAAALIPLRKNYAPFEGQYLESHFAASKAIPTDLNLVDSGYIDRFAIKTFDNKTLCYVDNTEAQVDFIHDIGMVICLAIGFFLLGMFGDHIAKQMLRQYQSPLVGTMFFFSVMVIMRLCVLWLQNSALLPYMDLKLGGFNEGVFVTSLAELLINTCFLFWLSIFFNSEFRLPSHADSPVWKRWLLASAFYSVIVLLLILCIGIFNDLVVNWHNLLSFNELSDFNVRSLLALFGIGIILLSVFLITHRLILSITDLMLNRVQHFFALDVAILVGTFYFEAYNLNLPTWMYVLFIFIYVIMFYQFISVKRPGLMWLVVWIVVFSAIQSFFIARFNVEKDKDTLENYAIYLSNERDTVAERRIKLMTDRIENNTLIQTLTATPLRVTIDPEKIAGIIKSYYDEEDYLSNQYAFNFSCFLRNSESLIPGDSITLSSLRHQYEKGDFTDKNGKVRFWTNKEGDFAYMALATVRASKDNPMYVALQFKRQDKLSSRVLTELFVDKHYKSIPRLNEYTYAIYKKGVCVEQNQSGVYDGVINDADVLGQTIRKHNQIGNRDEFLFKNTEGVVVKIGKQRAISSQGKLLTMYIILSLTALLTLITLLNHFIAFLPDVINLRFAFSLNSSLRNRIVFPSIAFILLSYAAIFYFTVEYFKDIDAKYYEQDVETKSNTIVDNVINQIKETNQKIAPRSSSVLNDLLSRYAQTYQNAMHLYTPEGVLAATTEPNLFDKGIMSKNMNTSAYYHLKLAENKIFKTDENIGNFHYKTSFYTVRDSTKHLLGFLELPYYSRDRNIRMGVSDVWSHNATILTLLFLLGICFIYIQAANIVKPLQFIADSLRRLSLGSETKNELITSWNQNDEIRVLIDDYNNKVVELEETFSKLAEAEREMAWREMAKQVAHEIRNPLTPIKLSVQHLEMIRRKGSDNLEEYLARTNKILLDQIDNLEKIVSEFANFAKMPQKATNELFVFNDLVASVGGLFAQKKMEKKLNFLSAFPKNDFWCMPTALC